MAYPEDALGTRIRIAPAADLTALPSSYSWQDVTQDVSFARSRPITIKAGSTDEQQESSADAELVFRNWDSRVVDTAGDPLDPEDRGFGLGMEGRYTTDNPESDLYPDFDLGVPVEIAVDWDGGGYEVQAVQYLGSAIDSWPGSSGNMALTTVTIAGLLRRLSQSRDPRSALHRTCWPVDSALRATDYWPMESTSVGTTQQTLWPNLNTSGAAATSHPGNPGAADGPVGSSLIPTFVCELDTSTYAGHHTLTPSASLGNSVNWRTGGIVGGIMPEGDDRLCSVYVKIKSPTGDAREVWAVLYCNRVAGDVVVAESGIDVFVKDSGGSNIMLGSSFGHAINPFDGVPHYLEIELVQVGGAQGITVWVDGEEIIQDTSIAVLGIGCPTLYEYGERSHASFGANTTDNLGLALLSGHVYYANMTPAVGAYDVQAGQAALGWPGEMAHERVVRLCAEEAVPCSTFDPAARSTVMGYQQPAALVPLLRESEKADYGILDDHLGLIDFIPATYLYNQDTSIQLDGASRELFMPFEPITDDQRTLNDCTASHVGGGPPYRFSNETHVAKVGRYSKSVTPNVLTDSQDANQASWAVNLGTVAGKRYPSVRIDFLRAPDRIADWLAPPAPLTSQLGARLTIVGPPRQHAKGSIELQVRGYTMTIIARRKWSVECNTTPYLPWEAFEIETGSGNRSRLDNGACTLTAGHDSTDTSLTVVSASVRWIDSATYSAMFPFDIIINGERMTCTAITGTTLSQTMTVTRSVDDVVRSHAINSPVHIWRPPHIAL